MLPGFIPFFRNKLPGLFHNSDWFFKCSKIHVNPYDPKISMLILLTALSHVIFLAEFYRLPELSRTSGLFPGFSSPGKCHNKNPRLSKFSRTRLFSYRWNSLLLIKFNHKVTILLPVWKTSPQETQNVMTALTVKYTTLAVPNIKPENILFFMCNTRKLQNESLCNNIIHLKSKKCKAR